MAKSKRVRIVILSFFVLSLGLAAYLSLQRTYGQEKAKQPAAGSPKVSGFNGDGQADILWRYYGPGTFQGLNVAWLMAWTGSPAPSSLGSGKNEGQTESQFPGSQASIVHQAPTDRSPLAAPNRMPDALVQGGAAPTLESKMVMKSPIGVGRGAGDDIPMEKVDLSHVPSMANPTDMSSASTGKTGIASIGLGEEIVFSQVLDTGWEIAGTGDFNDDGHVDIAWRYYGTGAYQGLNDIWFMNGTTFLGEAVFSQVTDLNWRIVGTGHFNDDKQIDILWRYYGGGTYQGLNDIWFMNGSTFVGEAVFSQVMDTSWRIAGTGDFNSDGKSDILWRNYSIGGYRGLNIIWFMDGSTFDWEAVFSQVTDLNWEMAGVADFNNDEYPDILWRYYGAGPYQGMNDIWYMQGTTFLSEEIFCTISDTNWRAIPVELNARPMGSIQVNSTPPGARVEFDGVDTGMTTPCTIPDVLIGNYWIVLYKDGYFDTCEPVTVVDGETTVVNITMAKNSITVTSPSTGATVIKGTNVNIAWDVFGVASSSIGPSGATKSTTRGPALRREGRGSIRLDRSAGARDGGKSSAKAAGLGLTAFDSSMPADPNVIPGSGARPVSVRTAVPKDVNTLGIARVNIDLYKGTTLVQGLVCLLDNAGTWPWPVSSGLANGTDYKLRVSCTSDASVYGESGAFTITTASVAITSPTSSSVWDNGSTQSITWTTNSPSENVIIELYSGATLQTTISTSTLNDGLYAWPIPARTSLPQNNNYSIKITTLTTNVSVQTSGGFIIAEKDMTWNASWTGLNNPWGITVLYWSPLIIGHGPHLAVTERGANRVTQIDLNNGDRTSTTVPLYLPMGIGRVRVFFSSFNWGDYPIVADYGNDLVKRIEGDTVTYSCQLHCPYAVAEFGGHLFLTYGTAGTGWIHERSYDLQTYYDSYYVGGTPVAIVQGNNEFYIADESTQTIKVYNSTFSTLIRSWTIPGNFPRGVALDSDGFVYVTVPNAHSVLKYSSDGRLVSEKIFASPYVPHGLYIEGYTMYVSCINGSNQANGLIASYTW